ncbi:UNVERIFIED_CONTAM: hypothetical protein HDU68_004249 [Siphonaria sp. JEL0065]|nr:hypothetical protein HDU68_004249 [Siphonaria sp. JEL0065]
MPSVSFHADNAATATKIPLKDASDPHDPNNVFPHCCRYHTVNSSRRSQQSLRSVFEAGSASVTEKA